MSLAAIIKGRKGKSGFGFASEAAEVVENLDLTGKTVLITGANSGLGLHSAQVLSARGAHIIALSRTLEKAKAASATLTGESTPMACEFGEPKEIKLCIDALVAKKTPIDAIICNAGIMALPSRTLLHGYEAQFLTNHMAHFILVTGLLENLTSNGRVVVLSSSAHKMPYKGGIQFDNLDASAQYSGFKAYGQSKLANLLFARELASRFKGTSKVAIALHPGIIRTNLGRHMGGFANFLFGPLGALFFKTIPQGAATEVYAACHPDAANLNGTYLADCNVQESSALGADMTLAASLWKKSEEIKALLLN